MKQKIIFVKQKVEEYLTPFEQKVEEHPTPFEQLS